MCDEKILVTRASMPPYEEYIEAIKPLWDSHWITNMGKYHRQLEKELRDYLNVPELSLMVNGHMALEMAIQAFEFPEGAEVITTPFTFISTTHAIVRNHLQPVFCDVKVSDGTMDETKIESLITEKTVAILPVHVYGNVCNVEEIQKIADKYGLKVLYDAAHAFGVKYKGRGIGNYGDASIFSFHATKVFNTIEGGAVAFKEHELYERLYNLKNFGIRGEELIVSIGANAKMNEFSAVMGLCNLKHIDQEIKRRRKIWEYYKEMLRKIQELSFLNDNLDATQNYAYFPIFVKNNEKLNRDKLYNILRKKDIFCRKYFYPLTTDQLCFKDKFEVATLNKARYLAERVLVLPLHSDLTLNNIRRITGIIKEMC